MSKWYQNYYIVSRVKIHFLRVILLWTLIIFPFTVVKNRSMIAITNDTCDCTRAHQSSVFWRDPFLTRPMKNRFNYRLGRVVWVGNRWTKKIYLTDCWPAGNIYIYIRSHIYSSYGPAFLRSRHTSVTKVRISRKIAKNGEGEAWNKDLLMRWKRLLRSISWLSTTIDQSKWWKKGAVCIEQGRLTVIGNL